jgi:predicted transcriptional regulator
MVDNWYKESHTQIMKKKRETIQIRIDTDLKEQLVHQAAQMGVSPSEFIRRLIRMAIEDDTKRITELQEGERDLRKIAIHILKCLQMMSRKQTWKDARSAIQKSLLPQILDQELYLQYAKIDRLDQYYKERDELFVTQGTDRRPPRKR